MPMEDMFGSSKAERGLSALLLMGAGTNAYDAFSAVNSSPWTSETFGGDPDKEKSLREYVMHAMVISSIYAVGGAYVAGSPWPIVGFAVATIYMYWLYDRAIKRARQKSGRSIQEGKNAQDAWDGKVPTIIDYNERDPNYSYG